MIRTQTAGLDGHMWRVVSSEEGCVDVEAVDQSGYSELDDAPVVTLKEHEMFSQCSLVTQGHG